MVDDECSHSVGALLLFFAAARAERRVDEFDRHAIAVGDAYVYAGLMELFRDLIAQHEQFPKHLPSLRELLARHAESSSRQQPCQLYFAGIHRPNHSIFLRICSISSFGSNSTCPPRG